MAFHRNSRRTPRRHAVILLVVLAMLTLFAIVGVTFVMYANSQSESARLYRDSESFTPTRADVPTSILRSYFLDQLLYDVKDDEYGAYSALRGHGLLRGMYGLNYDFGPNSEVDLENNGVPYNGTGRLHSPTPFAANPAAPAEAKDEYNLVNYTYYPADGFVRDPERLGARSALTAARQTFWGGFNAPYTYPDLNNLFLAAVKADGTVLVPSFHRRDEAVAQVSGAAAAPGGQSPHERSPGLSAAGRRGRRRQEPHGFRRWQRQHLARPELPGDDRAGRTKV
jgi:hypothetical protein